LAKSFLPDVRRQSFVPNIGQLDAFTLPDFRQFSVLPDFWWINGGAAVSDHLVAANGHRGAHEAQSSIPDPETTYLYNKMIILL